MADESASAVKSKDAGPAAPVAEKSATQPAASPHRKVQQLPRYHVVLLDDAAHTYEYVIDMLGFVFGYAPQRGYQLAREVDGRGRAIVATTHRELAELKRDQILGFGIDPRIASCKGSMTAIIEPA